MAGDGSLSVRISDEPARGGGGDVHVDRGQGVRSDLGDPANWDGCGGAHPFPQSGDDLIFPADAPTIGQYNDLRGLTVGRIVIVSSGDRAAYVMRGEPVTVTTGVQFVGTTTQSGPRFLVPMVIRGGNGATVSIEQRGGPPSRSQTSNSTRDRHPDTRGT